MPGEQEKFSIVSRAGIPNSRGKAENFSISREEMESLLKGKPEGFSRSMYWSYLIKKGNLMLEKEKDVMLTLKELSKKHNQEIAELLGKRQTGDWWDFDNILEVLERQQKELDEIVTSSLGET